MRNVQWAAMTAQILNLAALYAGHSSVHTAMIVGGATAIIQAVFPSVAHSMNAGAVAAVEQQNQ